MFDTRERKKEFLKWLYRTMSVATACKKAGVSRQGVYNWRDSDVAFRTKWAEVWEAGIDKREQVFDRMAMTGVESRKYKTFQDEETGTTKEVLVEKTVRDSPETMLNALQALRPDKWSKAGKQDGAHVNIGVANILALSDDQLARVIAEKANSLVVDAAPLKELPATADVYDIEWKKVEDEDE
jgi:hypothetical protein